MPISAGPNTLGESNLVFAYDVGDTSNSYIGEPTTNLNPYTLSDSGTDGSGQGSVGIRTIISSNYVRIIDNSSNTRQTHQINGLTGSTTYTFSIDYKRISGTPTFRLQVQNYLNGTYQSTIAFPTTVDLGIKDIDGWQTIKYTFILGSGMNGTRIWYQDGDDYTTYTHIFELRNPQLEAKSHATPFTNPSTTRSVTQGLIPEISNSTLDLTAASYDSNAKIALDGSGDYIKASQNSNFYTNEWTWEIVVKFTSNTGTYQGLVWAEGATGGGSGYQYLLSLYNNTYFHYRIQNSLTGWTNTNTANISFTPTDYNHIVWQFYNGVTNMYINGALFHTDTSRGGYSGGTDSPLYIGARNDGAYGAPIYPDVIRLYNKTLSAQEIQQNYRQYKSRFNLS